MEEPNNKNKQKLGCNDFITKLYINLEKIMKSF